MSDRDPHEEGRQAYMNGDPMNSCPYDGDDAVEWEGGWMEAEEEDR